MDPFFSASTLTINCDILEPATGEPYDRDPQGIAKNAEAHLQSTGIADTVYVGPAAEFFLFDAFNSVRQSMIRDPPRRLFIVACNCGSDLSSITFKGRKPHEHWKPSAFHRWSSVHARKAYR